MRGITTDGAALDLAEVDSADSWNRCGSCDVAAPDRGYGRSVGLGDNVGSCEVFPTAAAASAIEANGFVGAVGGASLIGAAAKPVLVAAGIRASLLKDILLYFEGVLVRRCRRGNCEGQEVE